MIKRLSFLALFAVLSTAAVCQPKAPTPPRTAVVVVTNAQGATSCQYTMTIGGTKQVSAAGLPFATFTVPESLVNADSVTAVCSGFAPGEQAPASLLSNRVTITLVALPPPVPPLPAPPTRDQIITAQNWGMQGEAWQDTVCTNGQLVPLWDPIITPMSTACRLAAYKRKHDVYGDRKVIIPIAWGYPEPGTALINVQGTDWTNDMPMVRARVLEAVQAGLYVDLNYAGDGASILDASGACAWQDEAPGYRAYGVQCAEALIPLVDAALRGDGSSTATGNLLPFVIKTLGWDGTFYGSATPDQVAHWSTVARASDPTAVLSMEFNVGHIPLGEGPGEYDPGGRMANFDLVKGEFDPANQGYRNDATWQISGRLLCSAWSRPSDMPAGDDPAPPCYVRKVTPRGPIYVDDFENDTYCWVRLSCTIGDVVAHAQYMKSIGWSVIEAPLSAPLGDISSLPILAHVGVVGGPFGRVGAMPGSVRGVRRPQTLATAAIDAPWPSAALRDDRVLRRQLVATRAVRDARLDEGAPLGMHVVDVGLGVSKEQMIWPNTELHVAPVEHPRGRRNVPEVNHPGGAMRVDELGLAALAAPHQLAITGLARGGRPEPASVFALLDLSPEALLESRRREAHEDDLTATQQVLNSGNYLSSVGYPVVWGPAASSSSPRPKR